MRMGLEKARRRDLSRHIYDPIDSFKPLSGRHARRYLNSPPKPKRPIFPDKTATLVVHTPTGSLRALWRRVHNCWGCYEASPELSWMLPLDDKQAGIHLRYNVKYRGWSFHWAVPHDKGMGTGRSPAITTHKRQGTNHGNVMTNSSSGDVRKDSALSRGVLNRRLVNNAAGLPPVQANF